MSPTPSSHARSRRARPAAQPPTTNPVRLAEKPFLRAAVPDLDVGDNVEVDLKIKEGDKERIQTFAGTVIGIRGGGLAKTFTVRRIVQGEGVERILPWHSPLIEAVRVTRKGKVRRAKLYYMRERVGKATRLEEILGDVHGSDAPGGKPGADGAASGATANKGTAAGAGRTEAPPRVEAPATPK